MCGVEGLLEKLDSMWWWMEMKWNGFFFGFLGGVLVLSFVVFIIFVEVFA